MGVKVREKPAGSGVWWIFIDHNGKRKAKKVGKDKKLAQEVAKKIEAKLTLGDVGLIEQEQKTPTFSEYAERWICVNIPAVCKPSTIKDYQVILKNHVLKEFGSFLVTDINRLKVKEFLMRKANEGLATSTIGHMRSVIGGVLNLALDDEVITANPAHRLGKILRKKQVREEINPLTREELSLLLQAFAEHFPRQYSMALTLARTGMRLGEVSALQWGDLDFRGRFIHVQRTFSRGKVETPKSGKSRRVDMSNQLTETLLHLKHQRKTEAVRKGWGSVPEWIFINESGKRLDTDNWRSRVFARALEKGGLRAIRIHDLRHTYASLLIQAGESLAYVRDQLGHHSIKVTVDIYGHLVPGANKAAVDRLDDTSHATIRNLSATNNEKGVSDFS